MSEADRRRWDAACDRALGFVLARGDALEALRARVLIGEEAPARVTRALVDAGALDHEDPAALLPALGVLDQMDQLDAPDVEPAVASLARSIGDDGAWGDPEAPLEERIPLTADLAGYLMKTLRLRPRVRDAADRFLCRTWNADRVKTGDWAPIAAYAHFFSLNESELSDPILQWCGRELERGFRTRHFDAVATARVLQRCRAAALPGASLSAEEICEALAREQTEDGGFALSALALGGEPGEAALDALATWIRLGQARVAG